MTEAILVGVTIMLPIVTIVTITFINPDLTPEFLQKMNEEDQTND